MKISFITTVFNEQKTIQKLLLSLSRQTKMPDEIIIVDGGSKDKTISTILDFKSSVIQKRLKIIKKIGNRSVGRNKAIKKSTGDIIVCTDAGVNLQNDWVENITKSFEDKTIDVVAGNYKPIVKNVWQKCLAAYTCVMPDKIDPNNFLPSSRSIAFKKSAWVTAGGYPEYLNTCEDLVFAKKMKEKKLKFIFAKNAIVFWPQRKNLKEAFIQFFNYAKGDAEAWFIRKQTPFLFLRYLLAIYFIYLSLYYQSFLGGIVLLVSFFAYILWSIKKNYRYVKEKKALVILPLLQFTADFAVISGFLTGLTNRFSRYVKNNKFVAFVSFLYAFFVLSVLSWGTPNTYHPFPYHMDEWHQFMAVKAIVKHGTTTIPGSAEIPFVYPVLSGLYLIPYILFHIVNPFVMKSPLTDLPLQQTLFEILRSVNIFFGLGSMLLIKKIAEQYLKINKIITVFFFVFTPSFLLLSTYFKYDVGLIFWIIFSLFLLLRFGGNPSLKNFIFASIASAVAMGTKFSAIPLIPLLFLTFLLFTKERIKNIKFLVFGALAYIATFLVVGIPSVFIGKANYQALLSSNLIETPSITSNFILPSHWLPYLLTYQFPIIFGQPLFLLSFLAFIYLVFTGIKYKGKTLQDKNRILLLVGVIIFFLSLLQLKIYATSNRALVLLPFLALMTGVFFESVLKKIHGITKIIFVGIFILFMVIQLYQVGAWLYTKYSFDPQRQSNLWIENNIKPGVTIGIEAAALYQNLPNNIVKEFYLNQYNIKNENRYRYVVIDATSKKLPSVVVLTNEQVDSEIYYKSVKKDLRNRLLKEKYRAEAVFGQNYFLINFFTSNKDVYIASLTAVPNNITVYIKQH